MRNFKFFLSSLFVVIYSVLSLQASGNLQVDSSILKSVIQLDLDSTAIENITGRSKEGGFQITWNIKYDFVNTVPIGDLFIRYKRKIDKDKPWIYSQPIDNRITKYTLKDLSENEKYVFQLGVSEWQPEIDHYQVKDSDQIHWSEVHSVKTKRSWGLVRLLILLGALGMFIYGMKVMSEGLQQAAGSSLRKMLASITSNRIKGVLTGFGITSIVQSSSVTTVMTVSFVNAGLLTLLQSAGVMMGANIGTTITAWLINFFGFKVSVSSYAFIILALGAPLLFFKKSKIKSWAAAIIGFALLFMGLGELKEVVPKLDENSALVQFFVNYKDAGYLGILMFVGLGTLATIIIQSSSAAMALTMTLVANGVIPFEVAAAMILGENIGTTITAELASTIGNVHAKRSARIHSMFNIIGVTWAVILFPVILAGIKWFMIKTGSGDPFTDFREASNTGLAIFHTAFNTLNVLLLIGFVPFLVKLAIRTVKSKGQKDEQHRLEYLEGGVGLSSELSILEAKRAVSKFAKLSQKMYDLLYDLINEKDPSKKEQYISKIAKYEDISDNIEEEVSSYLVSMSKTEQSEEMSERIMGMLSIANDLEIMADIIFQMCKNIERKNTKKIWFSEKHRRNINEMFELVGQAFTIMQANMDAEFGKADLEKAEEAESKINDMRNKLRKKYLKRIEDSPNIQSELIYYDIFTSLEKLGDHIMNVSEALEGQL